MAASPIPANDRLFQELERTLKAEKSRSEALNLVAQAPFAYHREMGLLFLGFISFFVLDDKGTEILPGGVTDNNYYHASVAHYTFNFSEYRVPMSAKRNSVVQAITSGEPVMVTSWETIRRPKIQKGYASLNQADGGIGCSVIYPLTGKVKGAIMYNFFQYPESIGEPQEAFMHRYTDIVSDTLSEFKDSKSAVAA
jgi:hypothetical protein